MKRIIITALILVFTQLSYSQIKDFSIKHVYPIEAAHSYMHFIATYMGYADVRGDFSEFSGAVYYDPENVENTSVSFRIMVSSIDSNNDWRDKDLKSPHWFDAESFPEINFVSKSAEKSGEGLIVVGDLTIKDVTKEVTIKIDKVLGAIKDIRGDDQVIFTGTHQLNRKDYGVQGERWSRVVEGMTGVGDEVRLEFSILAKRINAGNFINFLGRAESPSRQIHNAYLEGGIKTAITKFENLKSESKTDIQSLNMVGYLLLKQDKLKDALAIMERNAEEFPNESSVYSSLGGVLAYLGELKRAKQNYQKALELDPKSIHSAEILRLLE
ncbi:MAG: YceI family protein [bacterium]|nr:YceI family protein [bacterium]